MTKEQIQALIDAKIAGQGSAVDVGGALPAILSAILDLATKPALHILTVSATGSDLNEEQFISKIRIDGSPATIDDIRSLCNKDFRIIYGNEIFTPTSVVLSDEGFAITSSYITIESGDINGGVMMTISWYEQGSISKEEY